MLRQAKDVEDAIKGVRSRASKTPVEVSRHSVGTPFQGLCHGAKSCRPGLMVPCSGMCASRRCRNEQDDHSCQMGCHNHQIV